MVNDHGSKVTAIVIKTSHLQLFFLLALPPFNLSPCHSCSWCLQAATPCCPGKKEWFQASLESGCGHGAKRVPDPVELCRHGLLRGPEEVKHTLGDKVLMSWEVVATGVFMILVLGAIILQVNKQRGYLLPWIHWCFHSLLLDRSLSLNPRLKDLYPMCVVAMEDLQDQYDSQAQSIEVFLSLVFELLGVGGRRLFTRWTKWPVHLKIYSGRWRLYKWRR